MNTDEIIDDIARELGVSAEARKKWRQRHCVPYRWRLPILNRAAERGVQLTEGDFETPIRTEIAST